MTESSNRQSRMQASLRAAFNPLELSISDDSAKHAGHAGAAPGGETHFTVRIVAASFDGQSRVARSRAVHAALAEEFATGLHALALILRSPHETAQEK